jgi:hypothetical protein
MALKHVVLVLGQSGPDTAHNQASHFEENNIYIYRAGITGALCFQ